MSWQAVAMYLVVGAIGVPAAFRNITALAMVIAWLSVELVYQITGDSLPLKYSFMADIAVIAVIYAKTIKRCGAKLYSSLGEQLLCMVTDLTPWDRWIAAIYLFGAWPAYVLAFDPYAKWMLLWALAIAQFLLAGGEALACFRAEKRKAVTDTPIIDRHLVVSSAMSFGVAERFSNHFPKRDSFVKISECAGDFGFAVTNNGNPSALSCTPRYSGFPARVVALPFGVFHVRGLIAVAQIRNAVIRWIAVNVINVVVRPSTIVDGPSDAACAQTASIDRRTSIATTDCGERFFPRITGIPGFVSRALLPKQLPRLWLISEKLTKRFRGGYFSGSHGEESFRGGQGRAVSQAPFRPVFSSINQSILQRRDADATFEPPVNSDSPSALLVACEGWRDG